MSDLISRQDAIDNLERYKDLFSMDDGDRERCVLTRVIKELNAMPSVQPRKGKISYTDFCEELWGQSSICSLCGCSWQIADDGSDNFCPNCGCLLTTEKKYSKVNE